MSRVVVENDQLVISVQGARKVFALKSEITIPLANVTDVKRGLEWQELPGFFSSIRVGSRVPGYIGGTYYEDGTKAFYDVTRRENAVVISIKDDNFDTVVIGVDDCEATVALIKEALTNRG